MDGDSATTGNDAGDTGPAERQAVAERRRGGSRDPKVFVLLRELSEVHLLLDNVSANPDTTVSELIDKEKLAKQGLPEDWIEEICQISWPPDGSNEERAEDAALLIRAKDYLNRMTRPASGATIAFTHLVTQEARSGTGFWSRLFARFRRTDGEDEPSATDRADETRRTTRRAATRRSLAETAYPDLVNKADSFRYAMRGISFGLVFALLITCILSWYVAYGNAALAELAAARQAVAAAQTEVNRAETEEASGTPTTRPAGAAGRPASTPAAPPPVVVAAPRSANFVRYCDRRPYNGPAQAQQCEALLEAQRDQIAAEQRVSDWTCLEWVDSCDNKRPEGPARAAALANIMASAVLPFLYGLLGAGAAIVRSMSRKIRQSLLSPRDLHLSFQQLALGAVVGACIGLFVAAPGSDATGESLLGPVALSGSAISFVAGFGVDAVFQALESLIGRIFNLRQSAGDRANGAN